MDNNTVMSDIRDTVSISMFNKGLAGKIFEEVHRMRYGELRHTLGQTMLIRKSEFRVV